MPDEPTFAPSDRQRRLTCARIYLEAYAMTGAVHELEKARDAIQRELADIQHAQTNAR